METPIAQKPVNALIADAEMGFGARFLLSATSHGATEIFLKGLKLVMGGLWVGGTATLYETKLRFRPNALNEFIHAGVYSVKIPLQEISDIQVRFGFITKIINIVTPHGRVSIRCFGAEDFANMIRTQRDSIRDNG
jgi:hypothetical protein